MFMASPRPAAPASCGCSKSSSTRLRSVSRCSASRALPPSTNPTSLLRGRSPRRMSTAPSRSSPCRARPINLLGAGPRSGPRAQGGEFNAMKRWTPGAAIFVALIAVGPSAWSQANLGLPEAPADQVGMSKQKLDRIHDAFKQEVEHSKLAGTVELVARKGKLIYADAVGFQDKEEGKPMALDALFRIYSMTKPLVSVGAMMLVEDGKIQLTDPVSKFLPAFKGQQVNLAHTDAEFARVTYALVPADREMTVQDLLRHTSGLAYGEITQNAPVKEAYSKAGLYLRGVRDFDARDVTPAEEVDRLAKAPLAHQPGTVWEYGLSVDLLGRVVEAVSGKRLADFLDERLFRPLRMNDTGFWVTTSKMGRLAQPLAMDAATAQPIKLIDISKEPKNDSGGAGGISTAADYLRFAQMLLYGAIED